MKYKAVIFDLDGTLVDSVSDIANAANSALRASGFSARGVDEYRFFIGGGAEEMIRKALPREATESDVRDCLEGFMDFYRKGYDIHTKLYDGMAHLLGVLCEKGFKLAVLSNKPQEMTSKIARRLLSGWNFLEIVGYGEKTPRKPDPSGAFAVCESLSVSAEETVLVGDSEIDMKTAVAAGMLPVGALWGFRDREELRAGGARYIIERPAELEGIIG